MRVRSLLASFGAAALLAALGAAPASAGTGASTQCSNGTGGTEYVVLTDPVTVAVEVYDAGVVPTVVVCYGTGATGDPTYGTGGAVTFSLDGAWITPTFNLVLRCVPDYVEGVAPECEIDALIQTAAPDGVFNFNAPGVCLVSLGADCAAYVPGAIVATGPSPAPLLRVTVLGIDESVTVPTHCIAVIATCP
jgi:hypothetical protein